jgi:hypothetical protein
MTTFDTIQKQQAALLDALGQLAHLQESSKQLAEHLAQLPIVDLAKAGVDVALVNKFIGATK